jgi:crotonobetainyl-CoA:carnitine CoA-transferase CaiB-like acyl-CoA transferase
VSNSSEKAEPLSNLKVLELGHVVAAPYASLMLADLGAEVVKIEHPEHGDHMRVAGDTARSIFASMNRDKSSVALDLTTDADKEALLRLVEKSDVLIENYSPGSLEKLDLGYDQLQNHNEALIYISIKGFSKEGPYAGRAATDPIVQAMSGLMSVTGHSDRPPSRAGTSAIDVSTAQNAVVATLIALQRRREAGTGEEITIPMFRTGVAMMSYWLAYRQQYQRNPQRLGASHSLYAPYDVYPTADEGHVFIGAASDRHWEAIKAELELSFDYPTREQRLENRATIDEAITNKTVKKPRAELVDRLLAAGIPAAPVNEVDDLIHDPHLEAVGALTHIDTEEANDVAVPGTIPWLQAPSDSTDPPDLGGDTQALLSDLDGD